MHAIVVVVQCRDFMYKRYYLISLLLLFFHSDVARYTHTLFTKRTKETQETEKKKTLNTYTINYRCFFDPVSIRQTRRTCIQIMCLATTFLKVMFTQSQSLQISNGKHTYTHTHTQWGTSETKQSECVVPAKFYNIVEY